MLSSCPSKKKFFNGTVSYLVVPQKVFVQTLKLSVISSNSIYVCFHRFNVFFLVFLFVLFVFCFSFCFLVFFVSLFFFLFFFCFFISDMIFQNKWLFYLRQVTWTVTKCLKQNGSYSYFSGWRESYVCALIKENWISELFNINYWNQRFKPL